ncbi:hypothetical protein O0I10_006018 [Lichtheimia ornata]|uniref:HbrB-domain-containing protein n=1 Tax=Lichtheimia ornata TaxID=688661 RepID=A0AAD7V4Z0_9FUNG|nr:uncharacterized protein O0I10_006018 [Lichtheimia ornata]KAJ8658335.1 hypothetical protein O0I10_006018 [Lichtheimia ornata]
MSSASYTNHHPEQQSAGDEDPPVSSSKMASPLSASSDSSSAMSNYIEHTTPTSLHFPISTSPPSALPASTGSQTVFPTPSRSYSATTPTMRAPPSGGSSQTKRHSLRSPPPPPLQHIPRQGSFASSHSSSNNNNPTTSTGQQQQSSSQPLERTISTQGNNASTSSYQQRPTSPITSPSIHKSLNALDAKSITRDIERTSQYRDDMITSPSSPTASINPSGFYFSNANNTNNSNAGPYHHRHHPSTASAAAAAAAAAAAGAPPPPPIPSSHPHHPTPYMRQGSVSSISMQTTTVNPTPSIAPSTQTIVNPPPPIGNPQGDVWQSLCVRVLPLFNGEGVKGNIEDLNELLRRCLTDPVSPQLYRDIESLLRDGMFTLNAKMLGVTDEKLLDRLVEQWSFFFTYALPYFEAVFLPLRTDVRYRSLDEAEMWNVRNMALRSFRDNVILLQTKRLEDVFAKLFTDFGSSQNPAATAAKMLQMTSLLASAPDHNEEIERVLSSLKANWKIMMTKGDRRGFAGVRKPRAGTSAEATNQIFGTLT